MPRLLLVPQKRQSEGGLQERNQRVGCKSISWTVNLETLWIPSLPSSVSHRGVGGVGGNNSCDMPYVLAKALANPPHAEGAGTAAGLNYFDIQYKDLILNSCIISTGV